MKKIRFTYKIDEKEVLRLVTLGELFESFRYLSCTKLDNKIDFLGDILSYIKAIELNLEKEDSWLVEILYLIEKLNSFFPAIFNNELPIPLTGKIFEKIPDTINPSTIDIPQVPVSEVKTPLKFDNNLRPFFFMKQQLSFINLINWLISSIGDVNIRIDYRDEIITIDI